MHKRHSTATSEQVSPSWADWEVNSSFLSTHIPQLYSVDRLLSSLFRTGIHRGTKLSSKTSYFKHSRMTDYLMTDYLFNGIFKTTNVSNCILKFDLLTSGNRASIRFCLTGGFWWWLVVSRFKITAVARCSSSFLRTWHGFPFTTTPDTRGLFQSWTLAHGGTVQGWFEESENDVKVLTLIPNSLHPFKYLWDVLDHQERNVVLLTPSWFQTGHLLGSGTDHASSSQSWTAQSSLSHKSQDRSWACVLYSRVDDALNAEAIFGAVADLKLKQYIIYNNLSIKKSFGSNSLFHFLINVPVLAKIL